MGSRTLIPLGFALLLTLTHTALAQSKGVAVQGRGAPSAAEPRIALVIGNGNYAVGPLRNPVNDAAAIASVPIDYVGSPQTAQSRIASVRRWASFARAKWVHPALVPLPTINPL